MAHATSLVIRPELALCQLTLCRWSLQRVLAEAVGTVAVTELGHDLSLNLAHALAGQAKLTADLVQGTWHAIIEAVAQTDDILLALFEGTDNLSLIHI